MANEEKTSGSGIDNLAARLLASRRNVIAAKRELLWELEQLKATLEREMNAIRQRRARLEAQLYHRERQKRPIAGG